ncbi:MAG: ATP-grasp domain-containing protein [Desulfobacterales bacterium]|nr:ATP-grasp domain-containing protein [Desulfobacterales bacterium]
MNSINVFVTGVGGGGHGEQIVKALKIADTNYTIIGGDVTPYSKGLADVHHAYILPPADSSNYIESLIKICKMHGVSALFHGSEPELKAMSASRKSLENQGLFLPLNPEHVIETCMDKLKTLEFLKRNGFHFPDFLKIASTEDLEYFDKFPAVLKPSVGSGGSANTFLAQNMEELLCFGRYLLSIYPEFIVQEYVGSPDCEYTVGVLTSMDGDLLNSIAVKRNIISSLSNCVKVKNRTQNRALGEILSISSGISQGEIGSFPEVTRQCEEIALALGARGPLNIQCRLIDGKAYTFEINPRFSGTTSLRAMVGYNEPDVLIRKHVMNEEIKPYFEYGSGVILRGLSETLLDSEDLLGMSI